MVGTSRNMRHADLLLRGVRITHYLGFTRHKIPTGTPLFRGSHINATRPKPHTTSSPTPRIFRGSERIRLPAHTRSEQVTGVLAPWGLPISRGVSLGPPFLGTKNLPLTKSRPHSKLWNLPAAAMGQPFRSAPCWSPSVFEQLRPALTRTSHSLSLIHI